MSRSCRSVRLTCGGLLGERPLQLAVLDAPILVAFYAATTFAGPRHDVRRSRNSRRRRHRTTNIGLNAPSWLVDFIVPD